MIKTSLITRSFFCNPDVKQKTLLIAMLNGQNTTNKYIGNIS